jgi:hypothetical protein
LEGARLIPGPTTLYQPPSHPLYAHVSGHRGVHLRHAQPPGAHPAKRHPNPHRGSHRERHLGGASGNTRLAGYVSTRAQDRHRRKPRRAPRFGLDGSWRAVARRHRPAPGNISKLGRRSACNVTTKAFSRSRRPCHLTKTMASENARAHAGEAGLLVTEYCYTRLPRGHIRLLRLMPHPDQDAPIRCELFNYPFDHPGSRKGTSLYEALSYVWGSGNKPLTIFVDDGCLRVTRNLHEVLLRLRDHSLPRIIWIDDICINQKDTEEREYQVGFIAQIYARASRIIVWLEEIVADHDQRRKEVITNSDRGLEIIGKATTHGLATKIPRPDQDAVLTLLQRSWFQRLWVRHERPKQSVSTTNSRSRYCRKLLPLATL